jgi:hypothetical protein
MKNLKVSHLHWGFPPIIGGVETHLAIILPEMVKKGLKVSLLTSSYEGGKDRENYENVDIYRVPLMDLNWLYKRGLKGLEEEIIEVFSNFITQTDPQIVHVHNMHYFSEIHVKCIEKLCTEKGIPLLLTAHNYWDDILFLELTHKIKWTRIIAVSHFIKSELISIGIPDELITVIHHGIDTEKFTPTLKPTPILKKYPQLKNKEVVFHPARISLSKGCDVSIKAINIVKETHPNIMLVLAGSKNIIDWGEVQEKDIAYLVKLIKHFKLEENILIDAFTLEEMRYLYRIAKVCVYPSTLSEPFGLVMLEAGASKRPIIVTNSGGMPEIIKDGINGFVIPIKDFEALAAKITLLLENMRLRRRLGYTAREIVESQYNKERVVKDIISLYEKTLQ